MLLAARATAADTSSTARADCPKAPIAVSARLIDPVTCDIGPESRPMFVMAAPRALVWLEAAFTRASKLSKAPLVWSTAVMTARASNTADMVVYFRGCRLW